MNTLKKLLLAVALIIVVVFGIVMILRVTAPSGITYNPADEGYCVAYGIEIDASSVEKIFAEPESVLADPEAFLSSDDATLVFSKIHYEWNEPLNTKKWLQQIQHIHNLPEEKREQEFAYKFAREIRDGQETWCKIAVPHVLSYLPESTEVNTKVYLLAFDPIVSGQGVWGRIVMSISHPLFRDAERVFHQGSTSVLNILAHELFHIGYGRVQLMQTEIPLNMSGAIKDMLVALQNEGMAVHTAFTLSESYPCPFETVYRLHQCKLCVRYMLGRVNRVFDTAMDKSEAELYHDIQQLYSNSAVYMVGGYMAGKIEEQLGKEALVNTLTKGPRAFVDVYNSIAEKGMDIHYKSSEQYPDTLYLEVLTAAIARDYDGVRENLDAIRTSDQPMDIETDGYLVYKAGYAVLHQGQLALAEEIFTLLIDAFPNVASLYIGLGDVYVEQGNTTAAVEQYEQAMVLEPRQQWLKVVIKELEGE